MSLTTLITIGSGIMSMIGSSDDKAVADKVDTATAGGVVIDLLSSLAARTDNKIDDALVNLVKGSLGDTNIDNLILNYLESLVARTDNKIDDYAVGIIKHHLSR